MLLSIFLLRYNDNWLIIPDADGLTYSVSPRDYGVGEGSWSGLCFNPTQLSMVHNFLTILPQYSNYFVWFCWYWKFSPVFDPLLNGVCAYPCMLLPNSRSSFMHILVWDDILLGLKPLVHNIWIWIVLLVKRNFIHFQLCDVRIMHVFEVSKNNIGWSYLN